VAESQKVDVLILGGGSGGSLLAWHLASAGRKVAVIERRWLGGSCPNVNCLPTKNEIYSSKVAQQVRFAAKYGMLTESVKVDMAKVRQRKREMVRVLNDEYLDLYRTTGAELIMGEGRFVGPKTVEVQLNEGGTRVLEGDSVILNLGTHAAMGDIPGLAESAPLTNIEALELDYVPSHLVVLGGGYVGLELAQAFRRFGSRVTVVNRGDQITEREDADVAAELQRILASEGIEFELGAELMRVEGRSGSSVSLHLRTPAGEQTVEASDVLVATGRAPNTAGIGLDVAGVELNEHGFIRVNERLETTAPDVWAIGEAAGSPQFTHVSFDDSRIVEANLTGGSRTTSNRLIPYCMFTDPPLARVGLSERDAQRLGIEVRVAKVPTRVALRTRTVDEEDGFAKALVSADDDTVLGFMMIGSEAGEVMTTVQAAMLAGFPYTGLRDAIIAHPTMSEVLWQLFSVVPARARVTA
jgi:pyruvate/2-oxoglutarate dehydrogenase complex dihydrolipoamide dehydrogenase (E3) component